MIPIAARGRRTTMTMALRIYLWLVCSAVFAYPNPIAAQTSCASGGYRVVARRWDAVLKTAWELRQDCVHPERPARTVQVPGRQPGPGPYRFAHDLYAHDLYAQSQTSPEIQPFQPPLIHAGDRVRLWQQDARVRIEMSGIAEQSAHSGEHVVVRISRQSEDAGLDVQRYSGIVRGPADVEMER